MYRWGVDIRDTAPGDAALLAAGLRAADRAELDAWGWPDHCNAIEVSVSSSEWSHTAWHNGRLICIVGLGRRDDSTGVPWMLATDQIHRHQRALARASREYTAAMLMRYPRLLNMVHADNATSIAWLTRLGFELYPPQPHPKTGALFHHFEMHAHGTDRATGQG